MLRVVVPFPSGRPERAKVESALQFLARSPIRLRTACPLLDQPGRWLSDPAYLCGSDQERADELLALWSDPANEVVWCGRGGYGATRLLGLLQKALEDTTVSPSRFLGYSDITALFAFIRCNRLPIECVHTPVLTEIPDHPQPDTIFDALHGKPCPIPVKGYTLLSGIFDGPIWGGNLAVLASLCGTPWLPKIEQGALFLEDIDEAPYRLDRFVTQLHDSGFFSRVKGVFLGQFTRCGNDSAGLKVVKQRLKELKVPPLGELPVGHEAMHLPLFLDCPYRYDSDTATLYPGELVSPGH